MNTSQTAPFLAKALDSELRGKRIPKQQVEYFRARFMFRVYSLIQDTFYRLSKEKQQLTKAYLAKRLGRGADQVSRWMNSPGNLELKTVSDILLAMGHEPVLDVRDLAVSGPLPPTQEAWLRPQTVLPKLVLEPAGQEEPPAKSAIDATVSSQARGTGHGAWEKAYVERDRPRVQLIIGNYARASGELRV